MLRSLTRRQKMGAAFLAAAGIAVLMNCGQADPGPSKPMTEITVNAAAGNLNKPIDAAPNPLGKDIYFIATGPMGAGVFHVSAAGGTVDELYSGTPLVDPRGIAVSPDGTTLYVADRGAGMGKDGAIFKMPATGDTPAAVPGTEGSHPTALDIFEQGTQVSIDFTGTDSMGNPEVLEIPIDGGKASVLFAGAPLAEPNGIAVSSMHQVYVSDVKAGDGGKGQVFTVGGGKAVKLGPTFTAGDPTGIALTLDESKLLVSSLNDKDGSSQVLILDLVANASSVFNDVIKQNNVSGGVHRARNKDIYAWAGHTSVYSIKLRVIYADSSTPGGVGG
jgi:hypothetical protein